MPDIRATPEPSEGRVHLEVSGGDPGETFLIFRRDAAGITVVRDTSEGTIGYPDVDAGRLNMVVDPKPVTGQGWDTGSGGRLEIVDGRAVVSVNESTAAIRTASIFPAGFAGAPCTPGQTWHGAIAIGQPGIAPSQATVQLTVLDSRGIVVETIATQTVLSSGPTGPRMVEVSGQVTSPKAVAVRLGADVAITSPWNILPDGSFSTPASMPVEAPPWVELRYMIDWSSTGGSSLGATVIGTPAAGAELTLDGQIISQYIPLLSSHMAYGWGVDVYAATPGLAFDATIFWETDTGTVVSSSTGARVASGRAMVTGFLPDGASRARLVVTAYGSMAGDNVPTGASWRIDGATFMQAKTEPEAVTGASRWAPPRDGAILTADHALLESDADGMTGTGPWFDGDSESTDAVLTYGWLGPQNKAASFYGNYQAQPVYDYEAIQGVDTEYILAKTDGTPLATVELVVPPWGTWLKSPGRPFRNTKLFFGASESIETPIKREIYEPEGGGAVAVYASARGVERTSSMTLVTRTMEQADALSLLLSDGATVMLDTPPSWNVRFRYISIGDVKRVRALTVADGYLNLPAEARIWELSDVITVEIPQGVTVVDPGWTYSSVPRTYPTYATIPALTASYDDLAAGPVI